MLCSIFSVQGHEDDAYVDSLKMVYKKALSPEDKFNAGIAVARALSSLHESEAREYYMRCSEMNSVISTPASNAKLHFLEAVLTQNEGNNIKAVELYRQVIPELENNNLPRELADAYSHAGMNAMALGYYTNAIDYYERSNVLSRELNRLQQLCDNTMNMGRAYENMGNNTKALECYQSALTQAQELKDINLSTEVTMNIGSLYSEGINPKLGIGYLLRAAETAEKLHDTSLLINAYTYIANNHYYNKHYSEALKMYDKIKSFCKAYGNRNTYAGTLGNMGNVYADMGEIEKAMELQQQAVEMFTELGDKQGLTICYSALGIDYLHLKQYDKALEYFNKSLPLATEMNSLEDLIEIHQNLAQLYEEKSDYKEAYKNYKLYKAFSDSVYNSDNAQKMTEMELNYQFQNKQQEQELRQKIEEERYKRFILAGIAGTLILIIVIILIARSSRQRKRANRQLTAQKELLENHKKEITDSINYAKRIQESILPPDNYWKSILPDSFIFYRPKDIVSGDFYWIEQKGDSVCFAAVDCTGHGVPGALMSVVGFNLLTQAVNEMSLTVPSEILKHLDYGVTKTLRQSGDGKGVKDGMDLSLCSLDKNTNVLQYAGAFNSLYYVKNGEFFEIKADKFPIGVNLDGKVDNYTNHAIPLQKGDCVYLFSDGYADQFGGPKGKKFKYNQLKELLHRNHQLPIEEQRQRIEQAFDAWKGELEQVDDVVIIGVRI
jgi:serine phosphatase RsbU (regulator of sigma subunit)/lipopolysaccharide biosynthesis regulator YciM